MLVPEIQHLHVDCGQNQGFYACDDLSERNMDDSLRVS